MLNYFNTIGKAFLYLIFTVGGLQSYAQQYTAKQFSYRKISNIEYGIDTNFAGKATSLKLDLYKPVHDSNCLRPVMIVVHGGAWLAGDKNDAGIVSICEEFVQRGYMVASVNYRMGFHPTNYYVPYALCPQPVCTYAFDSAEYIRAAFRAVQDLKAAIRFLKSRSSQDSTDKNNFYLLGESAGAFTTISAAFADDESEKPIQAGTLGDVISADPDVASCLPTNPSLKRPDLGSIHGNINFNGENAQVAGTACFYGAAFNPSFLKNNSSSDTPWLYLYHQSCDVVVNDKIGKPFGKLYTYCYNPVNLCQPLSSTPSAWGSKTIADYIDTAANIDVRYKLTYLTAGGLYNCTPGTSCHTIDNISTRIKEVADFFSIRISLTNNPNDNCMKLGLNGRNHYHPATSLYPSLTSDFFTVYNTHKGDEIYIFNSGGQFIKKINCDQTNTQVHISDLPTGLYFVKIINQMRSVSFKVILTQ